MKFFKAGKYNRDRGFTLIEILVVIGIIAVLAAVVLIAINPARQFAQSRNSQRTSNVNAIINAIGQNMADHAGILTCGGTALTLPQGDPTAADDYELISEDGVAGEVDLGDCLVPDYIAALPFDPADAKGNWTDTDDYNTGYTIVQDSTTHRITVRAPGTELDLDDDGTSEEFEEEISITR